MWQLKLKPIKAIKIDPHCCGVKAMVGNPAKLATVCHIPR